MPRRTGHGLVLRLSLNKVKPGLRSFMDEPMRDAMAYRSEHPLSTRRSSGGPAGFTLIELLVVIAIIAVLTGILLPAIGQARNTAKAVRETVGARQLMLAYRMYADDNSDKLLVGFLQDEVFAEVRRRDELPKDLGGRTIANQPAARYPWRIAPYLDGNLDAIYMDRRVIEAMADEAGADVASAGSSHRTMQYVVSLFPSFGINSYFVGGGGYEGDPIPMSTSGRRVFGDFHVSKMYQPRSPSTLMAFASARSTAGGFLSGYGPVQGGYVVLPPYAYETTGRKWGDSYDEHADVPLNNTGNVALRYSGKGAAAMLDGHVEQLGWDEFNDMRLWADQATSAEWTIPVRR